MAYKNPKPSLDDESVGKEFLIRFSFNDYLTIEEAVNGINQFLHKNSGKIDKKWVKFAGNIRLRLADPEENGRIV